MHVNAALGQRTLVIGASSGIGRVLTEQLVDAGARVAAAARRIERIQAIPGVAALRCDVQEPNDCDAVVAAACEHLGGLDAIVYASATTGITPLDRAGLGAWQHMFATNLFGAALITKAALPHLTEPESQGRAIFLSSDSADRAFPGLVAYSASKAALGRFCQGLADEQPTLRVSEIVVGPTARTEIGENFDAADFAEWATRWFEGGFVTHTVQQPTAAAAVILDTLVSDSPPARVMAAGLSEGAATTLEAGRRQAEANER